MASCPHNQDWVRKKLLVLKKLTLYIYLLLYCSLPYYPKLHIYVLKHYDLFHPYCLMVFHGYQYLKTKLDCDKGYLALLNDVLW